jgi:peptidoglycan/LPS O-acetylase OafA/YrhL
LTSDAELYYQSYMFQKITSFFTTSSKEITFDPKNNALDFIRLFLALSVVASHSWHPVKGRGIFDSLGQIAVYSFFLISGYLITASWIHTPNKAEFFKKRFLRIYPAFLVCLVVTAFFFVPIIYLLEKHTFEGFISHYLVESYRFVSDNLLIYIQNPTNFDFIANKPVMHDTNGPLWSLIIEVKAYIMVAVLGALGLFKKRWQILPLLLFFWAGYVFSANSDEVKNTLNSIFSNYKYFPLFTYFLVGSLFYLFKKNIVWNWKIASLVSAVLVVGMVTKLFPVVAPFCITYLLLFLASVLPFKSISKKYGDLSYGVYIYSWPIQLVLNTFDYNQKVGFVVYFLTSAVLSLGAGYLSWNLVEKRFLQNKHKTNPFTQNISETQTSTTNSVLNSKPEVILNS